MRVLVEIVLLGIALGLTVPLIKSAIPYLPLIWLLIIVYFTWKVMTSKPVLGYLNQIKIKLSPGWRMVSYVVVAITGAALFSLYWWSLNSFFAPRIAAYQAEQTSRQQVSSKVMPIGPPKLPPTTSELEQHLREQIHFIQMSCRYFDQGFENEAKRMASSLHILFVSTQDNPSLLEQLRIRDELMFPDTA